jgi:TRAP-type C4-dicarboxylate transport system permease small subunit
MSAMKTIHGAVEKVTTPLVRMIRWAVFAILLYLVIAVNATILLREVFGISLPWILDSARLVAPWLAVFAAAAAFSTDSHPKMEFILHKLPPHLRLGMVVFIHALTVVLFGMLCHFGWGYAQMGKAITITSMDFLTLFPFYLSLPVGFGCITVITLERLLNALAYPQHEEEGEG